jgi:uncharacterized protein (TIGR00730 family)
MRICVFCGSKTGRGEAYRGAAEHVGRLIGERGHSLVYGGGSVGLMGALADAALRAGAEVVGVIPHALAAAEIAHAGLTELRVVASMHERKATMVSLADAFAALPGGYGTGDELFETVTWAQLGIHRRKVALLNVEGYFDPLLEYLDRAVREGFISPENRGLVRVAGDAEKLLELLG